MKYYKQMYHHEPENNIWGDCGRTVIACLLDLLPWEVPHFWDKGNLDGYIDALAWLQPKGYNYILLPYNVKTVDEILEIGEQLTNGMEYILLGKSALGCGHVVICKGNRIIHDPSLDNTGIIGPIDGYFWIELLVRVI